MTVFLHSCSYFEVMHVHILPALAVYLLSLLKVYFLTTGSRKYYYLLHVSSEHLKHIYGHNDTRTLGTKVVL